MKDKSKVLKTYGYMFDKLQLGRQTAVYLIYLLHFGHRPTIT